MKKLTFALFAVILLSLSSCQKITTAGIVGSWSYSDSSIASDVQTDNPAVTAYIQSEMIANQTAGVLTFYADGTYTDSNNTGDDSGTYTINGDVLTLISDYSNNDPYSERFYIDGYSLTTYDDQTDYYQSEVMNMNVIGAANTMVSRAIMLQTYTRQ